MCKEVDYDNQSITILTRDINGSRTTLSYADRCTCYAQVDTDIGEEDEILLVCIGDKVIYSQLADGGRIDAEDLLGFFA